jgi:periplasmic divalent cation tolerance protein
VTAKGRRGRPRLASAKGVRLLLTTVPARRAGPIARGLVEGGLVACVTAVPGARSVYRWRGKVERAVETLLLVKVAARDVDRVSAALVAAHPYEVPEVLVLSPGRGLLPYVRWIERAGGDERA